MNTIVYIALLRGINISGKNKTFFAIAPYSIETVAEKIGEPTEKIEKVQICGNAAFWSFDRKLYAKANWWKKTATPGIGEMVTIRTANTLRKIAEM